MNRRQFLGQTTLAGAALSVVSSAPVYARAGGALSIRFVGMVGFVGRSDGSLLAAAPGPHAMGHYRHVPFMMARAGSGVAKALGLAPQPGVVPGAFHLDLVDARPDDFVFRGLENAALSIDSSDGRLAVDNQADQLVQMAKIAPGKRLRGNLARWARTTTTIRGGRLTNDAGHPDAGKVWSFGSYEQRLADSVRLDLPGGTVALETSSEVRTFNTTAGEASELWIVNAATPDALGGDPRRLVHGELLFDYLVGATAIVPTCAQATGRMVPATDLPSGAGDVASLTAGVFRRDPPRVEMCILAFF